MSEFSSFLEKMSIFLSKLWKLNTFLKNILAKLCQILHIYLKNTENSDNRVWKFEFGQIRVGQNPCPTRINSSRTKLGSISSSQSFLCAKCVNTFWNSKDVAAASSWWNPRETRAAARWRWRRTSFLGAYIWSTAVVEEQSSTSCGSSPPLIASTGPVQRTLRWQQQLYNNNSNYNNTSFR